MKMNISEMYRTRMRGESPSHTQGKTTERYGHVDVLSLQVKKAI